MRSHGARGAVRYTLIDLHVSLPFVEYIHAKNPYSAKIAVYALLLSHGYFFKRQALSLVPIIDAPIPIKLLTQPKKEPATPAIIPELHPPCTTLIYEPHILSCGLVWTSTSLDLEIT